jgi:E3 SUMO-protein ligase RanBP2
LGFLQVYRWDPDTKEWKERGVGDLKILYHPNRKTYRVLLRRDQVHKIACNHYITVEMTLEPMNKSETAITWFAMDFSEEDRNADPKLEKLAARQSRL